MLSEGEGQEMRSERKGGGSCLEFHSLRKV